MGMVRCVRAALPLLRATEWARMVNVSAHSIKRQRASCRLHGGQGGGDHLHQEPVAGVGRGWILVNTVSPGVFAPETLKLWAREPGSIPTTSTPSAASRSTSNTADLPAPVTRARSGRDRFVGSRRNTYMTDANINVDGGSDFC